MFHKIVNQFFKIISKFFGAKRIIENIVDRSVIYSFHVNNIFDFRKSIKLPEAI